MNEYNISNHKKHLEKINTRLGKQLKSLEEKGIVKINKLTRKELLYKVDDTLSYVRDKTTLIETNKFIKHEYDSLVRLKKLYQHYVGLNESEYERIISNELINKYIDYALETGNKDLFLKLTNPDILKVQTYLYKKQINVYHTLLESQLNYFKHLVDTRK